MFRVFVYVSQYMKAATHTHTQRILNLCALECEYVCIFDFREFVRVSLH